MNAQSHSVHRLLSGRAKNPTDLHFRNAFANWANSALTVKYAAPLLHTLVQECTMNPYDVAGPWDYFTHEAASPTARRADGRHQILANSPELSELSAAYGRADDLAASTASRAPHPEYPRTDGISDERIRELLCETLLAIGVDCANVSVSVSDGVVRLTGGVSQTAALRRIEQLAADNFGVCRVDNQLRVFRRPRNRHPRSAPTATWQPTPGAAPGISAAVQRGCAAADRPPTTFDPPGKKADAPP